MGSYPVQFGKYLLLDRINVGGMAEVFRAKTFGVEGFERILAIKRILPSLIDDADFVRMFIDEARIAVQLAHPNIAQIYELGKHGASYYIAMEYLPSRDLRLILDNLNASGQLMSVQQAAFITSRLCDGLDYAHRRRDPSGQPMNIIHRDVSPQNILITYEGVVKVIDFGIAKAANRASQTQAGVLKGKFGYMSPEQVKGATIDRRSDIFAVGVLLYEMLTGERLFIADSDYATLERVRKADVPPPTKYNKKISPELEEIVLRALAREPEDRYQWASDLAEDLLPFLIEDRSVYNNKRLAQAMKEMYAGEIAAERMAMEDFLRIGPADATSDPGVSEDAPTSATPSRLRSMDSSGRAPSAPGGAGAGGAGLAEPENHTQIIESGLEDLILASRDETGEVSQLNDGIAATIPSDSADRQLQSVDDITHSGPQLRAGYDSLMSSEIPSLDEDDAATMVSVANPLLQQDQDNGVPKPAPAHGESLEGSYDDGDATVALTANPFEASAAVAPPSGLAGLFDEESAEPTGADASGLSSMPAPSDEEPPPPLPASLVDEAEAPGAPELHNPSMPPLEASGVTAPAPRAAAEQPSGNSGLLRVLQVLVLLSVALLLLVVWRWTSEESIAGTAVRITSRGPAPEKLQVFVDGQVVADRLPLQIPLPGDMAHVIEVRAEGYKSSPIPISPDVLLPGKVLSLPISLVKTDDAVSALGGEKVPDAAAGPADGGKDTPKANAKAAVAAPTPVPPKAASQEKAKLKAAGTTSGSSGAASSGTASAKVATKSPGPGSSGQSVSKTVRPVAKSTRSRRKPKSSRVSLSIGTRPSAKVWVNGKAHRYATPLMRDRALRLKPGEHTLLFVEPKSKARYTYRVKIPSNSKENKLIIILGKKALVKEGKATIRQVR